MFIYGMRCWRISFTSRYIQKSFPPYCYTYCPQFFTNFCIFKAWRTMQLTSYPFCKKMPVSHLAGKVELFWAYISTTSYFENSSQNTHMLVFWVYKLKYHVDSVLKKMCLRHVYSSCLILLCTTVKTNFWA